MKRILCIISSMNAGGAENFLMKIYRKVDRSKYQLDFCINVKEKCFYEEEILSLGGKIFRIPSKSENVFKFKKQLTEILRSKEYKSVLRMTSNAVGFMDLKIAKKAGVMICAARSCNSSSGSGLKVKIAHRLGQILYGRYVNVKIAPSDLAAKHTFGTKAYEKGDVNILHNAVDLETYRFDSSARKRIRDEFSIEDDFKVIGNVGRFMTQKNHNFLIDIFSEIKKKYTKFVLLLVGTGNLEDEIKSKVNRLGLSESVIFAGLRSDIPDILSAMDVFVMPSFFEGMPNTVIEAQATGLPCVISDTITKEADITGLVKYASIQNINKWVPLILESAYEPRKNTHTDFIKNRYDIDSTVEQFINLLN